MPFRRMIMNIMFQVIGFKSLEDLLQSTAYFKHKLTAIYLMGFTVSGLVMWVEKIINTYIYTPALGVAILFSVTVFDMLLGISEAISSGEGLIPSKLSRAGVRFVVQTLLVGLFFQMHNVWGYVISYWMVDSLLIIFTLSTFYSSIQNAHKLGLITDEQYSIIEGLVNLKKLINKIRGK